MIGVFVVFLGGLVGESEYGLVGFFWLSGGLNSFSVGVSSLKFCGFAVSDGLEAVSELSFLDFTRSWPAGVLF